MGSMISLERIFVESSSKVIKTDTFQASLCFSVEAFESPALSFMQVRVTIRAESIEFLIPLIGSTGTKQRKSIKMFDYLEEELVGALISASIVIQGFEDFINVWDESISALKAIQSNSIEALISEVAFRSLKNVEIRG